MIGIKSVSDLITNSSSETFIIRRPELLEIENFREKFKEITNEKLLKYKDFPWNDVRKNWNICSGVAGDLEIYSEKECLEKSDYIDKPKNKEKLRRNLLVGWGINNLPKDLDKFILVDIDRGFLGSIFWTLRNFEMIYSEGFLPVADINSRKIQDLWMSDEKYDEWKKLEDHPYLPRTKVFTTKMKSILVQKPGSRKILVYQSEDSDKTIKKIKEDILPKFLPSYSIEVLDGEPYGEDYAEDFLFPEIIKNELK